MTVRGLLLDLDDTLLDDRGATRLALDELLAAHGLDLTHRDAHLVSWRAIALRHWVRYEAGEIGYFEQRRCRIRDFLGRPLTDAEADDAVLPYVEGYERAWRLLPGVLEFLDATRALPKVVVTNGERGQQLRKMRATGLLDHMRGVVTPGDCGYYKPHPGIFATALEVLGLEAANCVMIGDDEARDIAPARALGMRFLHVAEGADLAQLYAAL